MREYKVVKADDTPTWEARLADAGKQGWKVVSTNVVAVPLGGSQRTPLLFVAVMEKDATVDAGTF